MAPVEGASGVQPCDRDGCHLRGAYRAPKARDALTSYYWFCLEHVREYNSAWNYYAGMSDDEVEQERRADTIWHRPSWPLGKQQPGVIEDPLWLMGKPVNRSPGEPPAPPPSPAERQALAVLGLAAPANRSEIKQRYKALAKKHHPDANGGDRKAEEKLKAINQAYDQLMTSFAGQSHR